MEYNPLTENIWDHSPLYKGSPDGVFSHSADIDNMSLASKGAPRFATADPAVKGSMASGGGGEERPRRLLFWEALRLT